MTKFTCQCSRCEGTGKFDRGTCFGCNGLGYRNSANTRGLTPFTLTVKFSNGSTNTPRVFASDRKIAERIIRRAIAVNGWSAEVVS